LDGAVAEGEAMPSVRQISLDMQINPITVSKAVQELESEGAVEKRRGLGMFVRDGAREQLRAQARMDFLQLEWPAIAARLARLEIRPQELFATSASGDLFALANESTDKLSLPRVQVNSRKEGDL
jgi:GntR family transcriptional regulator